MEKTTLSNLLLADNEKIQHTLLANSAFDQDLKPCVKTLEDEMGKLLLKYNASSALDPLCQTVSECMMSAARDQLELINAVEIRTEEKRHTAIEQKGLTALLLSVIFLLGGILFLNKTVTVGYLCMAFSVCFAYLSGRTWHKPKETKVSTCLNPDALLHTMKRTAETIDRKMEEFTAKSAERESEIRKELNASGAVPSLTNEDLVLYGDLLEALWSDNGEFALKQLDKLFLYLKRHGITVVEYDGDNTELFELLPTKRERKTLRPALLSEGKVVSLGRAAERCVK